MKKVIFVLSVFILIGVTAISASAKKSSHDAELSFAIRILEEEAVLKKGNVSGSAVSFSEEDFSLCAGEEGWTSLVIHTLPDKSLGVLQTEGVEIKEGQEIPRSKVASLIFMPSSNKMGTTEFTFAVAPSNSTFHCILNMGEDTLGSPKAENTVNRTYRNVAVFSEIQTEDDQIIEIVSPCKNGILELEKENGKYVYRPSKNFIGTDKFEFCISDAYGNRSEVCSVTFKIEKAMENLYFYDLSEKENHALAIRVCSEGLLPYSTDENGLPIFCADEKIDGQEFYTALRNLFPNAVLGEAASQSISEKEAIQMLSHALVSEFGKEIAVMEVIEPSAGEEKALTRGRCAAILEELTTYISSSYFVPEPS